MNEKTWHVNPATRGLESAYEVQPPSRRLVAAQPFTVSLKTVMVADDLDGWPRGNNDLLLTSSCSLGEAPMVQRVHFYADEIKPRADLRDFYAETMFLCEDYSGTERLRLEIQVLEVDTDSGQRKALTKLFQKLAIGAGAVFPVAMPYAALASGVVDAVEKLISALEKDRQAIDCGMNFYPPDRPDAGMPLQTGCFVVFSRDVKGSEYRMEPNFVVTRLDGREVDVAYAVFQVEPVRAESPKYVISQRVATLLTQIQKGNKDTTTASLEFLTETLEKYSQFKALERYSELRDKDAGQLTEEEKELMKQIGKRDELKPFLPG